MFLKNPVPTMEKSVARLCCALLAVFFTVSAAAQRTFLFTAQLSSDGKSIVVSGTAPTDDPVTVCVNVNIPTSATCDHPTMVTPTNGVFNTNADPKVTINAKPGNYVYIVQNGRPAGTAFHIPTAKEAAVKSPTDQAAKQDFTVPLKYNYCDLALPYSYRSTGDEVTLTAYATDAWDAYLTQQLNTAAPAPAAGAKAPKHVPGDAKSAFLSVGSSNALPFWVNIGLTDLTTASGSDLTIDDAGGPLLGSNKQLNSNKFDAQRLLVRTMFSPNPALVACAYPYLNGDAEPTQDKPPLDANGKAMQVLYTGNPYHFSIEDNGAPQYYLINVVRWKDAAPPAAPAQSGATKASYFETASDDWYLFNFSDKSYRTQDITKWGKKITPSLVTDTLRVLGSQRVALVAVHLAPQPAFSNPSASSLPVYPTEQAWFDDISVQYTIHADKVIPVELQDVALLAEIAISNVSPDAATAVQNALNPPSSGGAAPQTSTANPPAANPSAVTASANLTQAAASHQLLQVMAQSDALSLADTSNVSVLKNKLSFFAGSTSPTTTQQHSKQLSSILDQLQSKQVTPAAAKAQITDLQQSVQATQNTAANSALNDLETEVATVKADAAQVPNMSALGLMLRGAQNLALPRDYGDGEKQTLLKLTLQKGSPAVVELDATVERSVKTILTSSPPAASATNAQAQITPVTQAVQSLQADLIALEAFDKALKGSAVLSTYQGRYAAELVDNLTDLPAKLTPSWTATFTANTDSIGGAGVYDTSAASPAPATQAPATPAAAPAVPVTPAVPAASPTPSAATPHSSGPADVQEEGGADGLPDAPVTIAAWNEQTAAPPASSSGGNASGASSSAVGQSKAQDATAQAKAPCTFSSSGTGPQQCTASNATVLDEGLSYFDVSVAFPLTGYKDVTFQADTTGMNTVIMNSTTRTNAWALFDMFFVKQDLVNPPYVGIPHLVVGLPFAGKIFDKPYFAVGESINLPQTLSKIPGLTKVPVLSSLISAKLPLAVNPVYGYVWNKEFPIVNGVVVPNRVFARQFALEISLYRFKDALKTLGKSSSSSK